MLTILTEDQSPPNPDRALLPGDVRVCLSGMDVDTTLVLIVIDPALSMSSTSGLSRRKFRPEIAHLHVSVVLCLLPFKLQFQCQAAHIGVGA